MMSKREISRMRKTVDTYREQDMTSNGKTDEKKEKKGKTDT